MVSRSDTRAIEEGKGIGAPPSVALAAQALTRSMNQLIFPEASVSDVISKCGYYSCMYIRGICAPVEAPASIYRYHPGFGWNIKQELKQPLRPSHGTYIASRLSRLVLQLLL
jgi:hypothetical protein